MSSFSAWLTLTRVLVPLFCILSPIHSQRYQGDACTVNGAPGTCTLLQRCTVVYNELLAGKLPSEICGYAGFDPIVCCPQGGPNTPRPTTSSTTTTTTTTTRRPVTINPQINDERGALSRAKCAEYAQAVYALQIPQTLSANRKPVNVSLCEIRTRAFVVGGTKADPKEFPHMAAVGYNTPNGISWECGGTLISERFVLSAAHCTYSADWGSASWVRLGDLNLASDADGATPQDIRITDRIRHPRYKRPPQYHDVAVLKMERDVEFNAWIRPACLPYALPDVRTNVAIATGWGRVDWAEDKSNDLLKVTLDVVPQERCNATFSDGGPDNKLPRGIVNEWQICAGKVGKDTCQGDSGGPLAIHNNEFYCMYNVIGITSLGRLCGSIIPGVYSRVYNYVPWIENVVWRGASS